MNLSEDEALEAFQQILAYGAGCSGALSMLTEMALFHARNDIPPREALSGAEAYARLAHATGTVEGAQKLAAVLLLRFYDLRPDDPVRADRMWWEAAYLMADLAGQGDEAAASSLMHGLSERADAGDETAALELNSLIESLPPATLAAARTIANKIEAAA